MARGHWGRNGRNRRHPQHGGESRAHSLRGRQESRGEAQTTQREALGIDRANADVTRRKFMLDAPGERAMTASRASMVENFVARGPCYLPARGFGRNWQYIPILLGASAIPIMYSSGNASRSRVTRSIHPHLIAAADRGGCGARTACGREVVRAGQDSGDCRVRGESCWGRSSRSRPDGRTAPTTDQRLTCNHYTYAFTRPRHRCRSRRRTSRRC
jgi:hypothetical protein